MPQRDTTGIGERVPRELLDGDFTIAFRFVDMAQDESREGNGHVASQLLQNAEQILNAIRDRLLRMTASQKEQFEQRCVELSEAIAHARTSDPGIG